MANVEENGSLNPFRNTYLLFQTFRYLLRKHSISINWRARFPMRTAIHLKYHYFHIFSNCLYNIMFILHNTFTSTNLYILVGLGIGRDVIGYNIFYVLFEIMIKWNMLIRNHLCRYFWEWKFIREYVRRKSSFHKTYNHACVAKSSLTCN